MDYTRVKIYITAENLELLALTLEDMGVAGVELQEPAMYREFQNKQNEYDWDYVDSSVEELLCVSPNLTFYLEDTPEGIELLDEILMELCTSDIQQIQVAGVSDEDWKYKWKEYFKPTKITERLVVKPSWETYEKAGEELVIEIDPGMAFGTGTHPTTALCLRLLEKHMENGRSRVLDVGCGSGILAIAAALLGAEQVLGVEIDPVAVAIAKSNVAANGLSENVRIIAGDLTKGLDFRGDILTANLMADLVIALSEDAAVHLSENGVLIASGILIEKKEQVVAALLASGFHILEIPEEGEWCAIAAAM